MWRRYGMWLVLGLEFELAADIIASVIAPTWMDIAKLGAIAVIRTFLNYFLEQDLEKAEEAGEVSPATGDQSGNTDDAAQPSCRTSPQPRWHMILRHVARLTNVVAALVATGRPAGLGADRAVARRAGRRPQAEPAGQPGPAAALRVD